MSSDPNIHSAWTNARRAWHNPSVPTVIAPRTREERADLGREGAALEREFAFMRYPDYQTFLNLEKITTDLPEDPQRATEAIATHEIGHRFCPYDLATMVILNHGIQQALKGQKIPYDPKAAAPTILNLFTDMCINTKLTRGGESNIAWVYSQLAKGELPRLKKVYTHSMETAWNTSMLPPGTTLSAEECAAATALARLFDGNPLDKKQWKSNAQHYARIIAPFLEDKEKDQQTSIESGAGNIPEHLDDALQEAIAKQLAEIGSNGTPTNPAALREFQDILAGYGAGDKKTASVLFYDRLSNAFTVSLRAQPFGRPRTNPFQPQRWTPSMDPAKLDVSYSINTGGRLIPGVTTYRWSTRNRDVYGGTEEVTLDMDLFLDSSSSMPDPTTTMSLPVLAGFVAAKKAYRKGARIRATNFSGEKQYASCGWTRDLSAVFDTLVTSYRGGTVFPTSHAETAEGPRCVVLVTDADLHNAEATGETVKKIRKQYPQNTVTAYAIHPMDHADYLRRAGAQIIHGTTHNIFKHVIGKAEEVYTL